MRKIPSGKCGTFVRRIPRKGWITPKVGHPKRLRHHSNRTGWLDPHGLQNHTTQRRDGQGNRLGIQMVRNGVGLNSAAVAQIASPVPGRVAVEGLLVPGGAGYADPVTEAGNGGEIEHHHQPTVLGPTEKCGTLVRRVPRRGWITPKYAKFPDPKHEPFGMWDILNDNWRHHSIGSLVNAMATPEAPSRPAGRSLPGKPIC